MCLFPDRNSNSVFGFYDVTLLLTSQAVTVYCQIGVQIELVVIEK